MSLQLATLRLGFALTINIGRVDRIALHIRSFESAVEDEVGREGHEWDAEIGTHLRENLCAFGVLTEAGFPVILGFRDAHIAGGVDHCPGAMAFEGSRNARRI